MVAVEPRRGIFVSGLPPDRLLQVVDARLMMESWALRRCVGYRTDAPLLLLTAVRTRDFRMALTLVVGRKGGDGRLAESWLVRGGRGSLSPPAGIQPAG